MHIVPLKHNFRIKSDNHQLGSNYQAELVTKLLLPSDKISSDVWNKNSNWKSCFDVFYICFEMDIFALTRVGLLGRGLDENSLSLFLTHSLTHKLLQSKRCALLLQFLSHSLSVGLTWTLRTRTLSLSLSPCWQVACLLASAPSDFWANVFDFSNLKLAWENENWGSPVVEYIMGMDWNPQRFSWPGLPSSWIAIKNLLMCWG